MACLRLTLLVFSLVSLALLDLSLLLVLSLALPLPDLSQWELD